MNSIAIITRKNGNSEVFIVVTGNGSRYICGSKETAQKLAENLRKSS